MFNYLCKFGLKDSPFSKNSPDILVESNAYNQLNVRLKHIEKIKGIGLITGEPGLGKTTAVRIWSDNLSKNLFKVVYLKLSTISISEFYRVLADQLGLEPFYSRQRNFAQIQKEITYLCKEKRITVVLIIDEADYLATSILNDLKILLNFEMDSKDHFILLLVGHSSLRNVLNHKYHEALRQRIAVNFSFFPMEKDETKAYIDKKLKSSGLMCDLLTDAAYQQIINASGGVMRIVNQIMDKALLLLCNYQTDMINEEIAMDAISETII